MNASIHNFPWIAFGVFTVYAVIPAVVGLLNLLCGWLDDWEKTFKYPSITRFGFPYYIDREKRHWDLEDFLFFNCFLGGISGGLLTIPVEILRIHHGYVFWPILFSGITFAVVLYCAKKVMRLTKAFHKHIADKSAHK